MDKAPDAFRIISEVADDLDVPQHVLRFWESRFQQIKPMKRGGGRRYYRPDDVDLLRGIRHLLYSEGYTIRGVQRILREHGARFVQSVWQEGAPQPPRGRDEEGGEEQPARAGGRNLLGLLPGFLTAEGKSTGPAAGDDDESSLADDAEPATEQPTRAAVAAAKAAPGVSPHQVQLLERALAELTECRRLIDVAVD